MNRKHFYTTLVAAIFLLSAAMTIHADSTSLELASPKNDDHFEVTKPLFFWRASAGAQSYEVYVDDVKASAVPAAPMPLMNYGLSTPLALGLHHWYIKAILASGDAITTSTSAFTIDPPGNWPDWTIGPFERYGENPIIRPQGTGWEAVNTYNPGVLFDQGKFRMLYRGQGQAKGATGIKPDRISRVGYAESVDGVTFITNPEPIINATEPFERKYGCEDARFVKHEGTYYTFYTGNNERGSISLCEATSLDGLTWKKLGPIVDNAKNGALVCDPNGDAVQINGNYVLYVSDSKGVGICYSDDLLNWSPIARVNMKLPSNWVQPYEPCIAIADYSNTKPDNIVLFLAGTLNGKGKWFYAISETLFTKADLINKIDQLDDCILKPRESYENGTFKNCLWMNCIIQHNNQWMMYYGAGDRNVGLATAPVK